MRFQVWIEIDFGWGAYRLARGGLSQLLATFPDREQARREAVLWALHGVRAHVRYRTAAGNWFAYRPDPNASAESEATRRERIAAVLG